MVGLAILLAGCAVNVHYFPPLQKQLDSVVSVTMDLGHCSGWVLAGTHTVVTAAHCQEGQAVPASPYVVDFGDGKPHDFVIEKKGDGENFATGPDLMTLKTTDGTINWPKGFPVCKDPAYYGERVHLMGGPLAQSKTISFGTVSNPSRDLTDDLGKFATFVQYDGVMLPGNSGGPAVDDVHSCVVGVAELALKADRSSNVPFGLNFLTPAKSLELIK